MHKFTAVTSSPIFVTARYVMSADFLSHSARTAVKWGRLICLPVATSYRRIWAAKSIIQDTHNRGRGTSVMNPTSPRALLHTNIHTRSYTLTDTHIPAHSQKHTFLHTHKHTFLHTHKHTHSCILTNTHINTCTHLHFYVLTYPHRWYLFLYRHILVTPTTFRSFFVHVIRSAM